MTESFFRLTQQVPVSMIAVDEAHCVSQWGQDFRQSYLDIPVFMEQLPARPICTAFTATATKQVEADIARILKLQEPEIIHTGFDRKNLFFGVRRPNNQDAGTVSVCCGKTTAKAALCTAPPEKRWRKSVMLCGKTAFQPRGITPVCPTRNGHRIRTIFCTTARPLWLLPTHSAWVSTNPTVSFVIHYNMPKNMESYYQEAGLRDGMAFRRNAFCCTRDRTSSQTSFYRNMAQESEDPETTALIRQREEERLKKMTFYCFTHECLRDYILRYFGEYGSNYCGNCSNCLSELKRWM